MRRIIKTMAALVTVLAVIASMAGCTSKTGSENKKRSKQESENLMSGVKTQAVEVGKQASDFGPALNEFTLRLFKACKESNREDENMLLSPLSVLLALSMTANGANAETLSQMEAVLGLSKDELNEFAYSYRKLLEERSGSPGKLELANSIWFTADSRFTVEKPFLQLNSDYYGADVFKAAFDDSTVKEINDWVKEKTEGMIPSIINNISDDAIMFLINALAFDAKWTEAYYDFQVFDDTFTTAAGEEKVIPYLHKTENVFIGDENASGFIKYYKGCEYAFAALLPNEGISVDEYLVKLDGAHLSEILGNKTRCEVYTSLPKFKVDYSIEMSELLQNMGMPDAFDSGKADFTKLGTSTGGNISISSVLHKTYIAVDENGTKAGAATIVEMQDGATMMKEEPKEVYLTRPFIYMLIDCETNSPFFIGVMDCPE